MSASIIISNHEEFFGRWGYRIYQQTGKWKKATNAVARRLSTALYFMNLNAEPFSYEKYQLTKETAVFDIPIDDLEKLLREQYPTLKAEYAAQLTALFGEIRKKCESSEISTKALDLRGLLAAVTLVYNGQTMRDALNIAVINKSFDEFERTLVEDIVAARIDGKLSREEIFVPEKA